MKRIHRTTPDAQAAIGIVIADGIGPEVTPRVAAYVWGPAPAEAETEERKPAAA